MKYKLRGDYCFKTEKNEVLRNKRDSEGNVLEVVIIDSKQHEKAIAEQLHMLEEVKEKKADDKQSDNPESNDNGQQSLPLQGGSGTGTGKKGK